MTTSGDAGALPQAAVPDKLYDHHRQQLSAMLDGALPPDAARFMLRRLEHDAELAACWERWQVCGDVLRGQRHALLPSDFARRVAAGIAAGTAIPEAATAARRSRWTRWGGGAALAASVAVAALLVSRQANLPDAPGTAAQLHVVAASTSPPATDSEVTPARTAMPSPVSAASATGQDAAELAPLAVAVAAVAAAAPPRQAERRSRGQSQRAALRARSPAAPGAASALAAMPAADRDARDGVLSGDPFLGQSAPTARPWPRAILPVAPAIGSFRVDYGAPAATSFHPFEPRLVGQAGEEPARGTAEPPSAASPPRP